MKVRINRCSQPSWRYKDKIGEVFIVEEEKNECGDFQLRNSFKAIRYNDCETITHNMQNSKSCPQISQEVINGFAVIIDAQDEKGLAKYGRSIDDAPDKNYDWKLMALEESADQLKYMVREIERLKKENVRLKDFIESVKTNLECALGKRNERANARTIPTAASIQNHLLDK